MPLQDWSTTAANNATADASINWQEGQLAPTVNNSARAMMAAVAEYRADTGAPILTTGTAGAYAVTTAQTLSVLDSAANGFKFLIRAHVTNTADPTLNLNGIGAKNLVSVASGGLAAGTMVEGGVYPVSYRFGGDEFVLHGVYGTVIAAGAIGTTELANDAATNAKLDNMAEATIKGREAGSGTGNPQDLTPAQATAILNAFVASGASNVKGLVPAPGATAGTSKILREDATWVHPVVVQRVHASTTALEQTTNNMPYDDTIPQSGEGAQLLTASITPLVSTHRIRVTLIGWGSASVSNEVFVTALFRDSVGNALAATATQGFTANARFPVSLYFEHSPGTTSAVTYKIRYGLQGGTARFNGDNSGRMFGGVSVTTLVLEELTA